ncbi:Plastocyanin-like domain [Musa troglodytarum]|uniref:Plastocyanin-like domain n=1 Tax=Musa troglodytarum TaxID=320322 RepID=A0A9E7FZR2_9LILI|nr:Plastocyanin-like domain [Musa troglodytarum]
MAKLLETLALILLSLGLSAEATVFTVGDSAGWDISADLASWVANKVFYVGDALMFEYSTYHTVNEVDRTGYESCNFATPLLTGSNGNTTVPLTSAGERYFACGVKLHCLGGMKLHVNVESNQTAASPVGAPPSAMQAAPSPLLEWPSGTSDFPFLSGSYSDVARGSYAGVASLLCAVAWALAL